MAKKEIKKNKKAPDRYKSNNRVNLTYLKRMDRRKVSEKISGKTLSDFECCPHCKSVAGLYVEELKEILITKKVFFKEVRPDAENAMVSEIWKSSNYLCIDCKKPVMSVE